MSPNRAERRRLERAAKKTQRKEEKKTMKSASNSSQYNAKKSQKIAPHLQTNKTKQGGLNTVFVNKRVNAVPEVPTNTRPQTASPPKVETCIIKMKYAKCMGDIVADTFSERSFIAKSVYQRITSMTNNEDLDVVHASNTAIVIEDRLLSGIDDAVQESLIMTDFSVDRFMDLMSNVVDNIVTDAVVKIMGAVLDDREFVRDVLALHVFKDINNMFAKAIFIAADHVYNRSMEDDTFYDGIDCDDVMYAHAFFDDFIVDYHNYYNKHHLTPEMVLRQMMKHEGEFYVNNEYNEGYNTDDDIGHAYIEELNDDYIEELNKDNYSNEEIEQGNYINEEYEEDDDAGEVDEDNHTSEEDEDSRTNQENRDIFIDEEAQSKNLGHDVDIKIKKDGNEGGETYAAVVDALCKIDISNNDGLTINNSEEQ